MGSTIAGLMILTLFFASVLLISRTTLSGNAQVSEAARDAVQLVGERARTTIAVASTSSSGTCNLRVVVDNTGATSVSDLTRMDVIVQFPSGNNAAQRLGYVTGPVTVGDWVSTTISGAFEPGVLNPGETMTIDTQVLVVEAGSGTVTVSTPNGVIATASFPSLTPCV